MISGITRTISVHFQTDLNAGQIKYRVSFPGNDLLGNGDLGGYSLESSSRLLDTNAICCIVKCVGIVRMRFITRAQKPTIVGRSDGLSKMLNHH